MSGHSKWANIKHRKGRQDAVRGKIFTKLIRAITVAARSGGGDISGNSALRLAVDKALAENMPKDTIDRAIKRGAGTADGSSLEEVYYEGYGPSGVAVLVHCLTDNRNRTVAEVRHAFTKHGGNLGTEGSVAYLFTKTGVVTFAPGADESKLIELAIEHGADDVVTNDDSSIDVMSSPENFSDLNDALNKKFDVANAEIAMLPATTVALQGEAAEKVLRLIDLLEDLDDVQNVYTNADLPDDIYAEAD